ncbi:CCA tRNA nucleotidyltransferase, partial [bacterium]|nr:CCA tRNA nucleotidyltransferase [bacterium]
QALDPSVPAIIDPFDGMGDLFSKTIRAIGDPQIRFIEDHLRILRAVRFAAQLGFEIEQKTAEAIRMLSALVADLSPQWLWRELSKGMEKPAQLKKLLLEFNLWEHLWGDIFPSPKDNTNELKAASIALPQKSLWIMFFYDDAQSLPEKMSKLAERIEFPHKLRTDILEIARIVSEIKKFEELSAPEKVKILDSLQFEDAIALARFIPELSEKAEEILRKYPKIGAKPLISGNELSSLGLKGQKLKQVLAQIRLAQLAGKIKSTTEALNMAKKLI